MKVTKAHAAAAALTCILPLCNAGDTGAAARPNQERQETSLAGIILSVPQCARVCLTEIIDLEGCSDGSCLCLNSTLEAKVSRCVSKACTIAEGVQTKNRTLSPCSLPRRDRAMSFNVASITLCTISGVFFFARMYYKLRLSVTRRLTADDFFIVVSCCVGLACTVINGVGFTRHGLGKDVWTLTTDMVETFERFFYIQQILYLLLVMTIKMSILFFYLSIFPGRGTRVLLWCTVAFTAVFALTFILLSVWQCTPINYYWLRYVRPVEGSCQRINTLGWIQAGISILIDLWMIAIPLWEIRKLELHWKKKVCAIVMFMTGTFVTIMSILRLKSLVYFANSINPTWDEWDVSLWSMIEINVGVMCSCLPTLRLILVRFWPRVFASTVRGGSDHTELSRNTTITTLSAKRAQMKLKMSSVDTEMSPISPRAMEADTMFDLEAKYPTWEDDKEDDREQEAFGEHLQDAAEGSGVQNPFEPGYEIK